MLPFGFTCCSLQIQDTFLEMKETFRNWQIGVETLLRNQHRKRTDHSVFTKDQELEEIKEVDRLKNQFYGQCQDQVNELFQMVSKSLITDQTKRNLKV